MTRPTGARLLPVLVLLFGGCAGADDDAGAPEEPPRPSAEAPPMPEGAEAVSLLGAPLRPPELEPAVRRDFEAKLAAAEADLEADPESADALVWVGRRLGYLGRYRDAIDVYTRALELHPDDARLWRHRGHRWITVREFQKAEDDLRRAAELEEGREDRVEPDGLPNERGIPTSTLQGNIWYHLGLAHYLQGELEQALLAYREGLEVATHDDMEVATTYWLVNTQRRLGLEDAARDALDGIHEGLDVIESTAYMDVLLLHKGERSPEELLGPGGEDATLSSTTAAYGVGNWHFVEGRPERAREVWERTMEARDQWAAFGFIAAEAELARER